MIEAFNVKKNVENSIQNHEYIKGNRHVETFEVKNIFSRRFCCIDYSKHGLLGTCVIEALIEAPSTVG